MLELSHHKSTSRESSLQSEERQLLIASRQYATEIRWRSWAHLLTTLALLIALVSVVAYTESYFLRAACSVVIGLTYVRMFIVYHDYLHRTIFKNSWLAGAMLKFFGHLMLTPPAIWKRAHDHHHQHNSKIFGTDIGSFPIMTTETYLNSSRSKQMEYRLARSPWMIVLGYFSVFLIGMCIQPLFNDFKRNMSAIISLCVHYGAIVLSITTIGIAFTIFAFIVPCLLAMMIGTYLFYIQHNYPDAQVRSEEDWTYSDAALEASSYLHTGIVMRWFTGNIGYHHVHHLNAKIPFYRLPEAMAGLVGLQNPGITSLSIADIVGCLRLKLWDTESSQFITFREATSRLQSDS